MLAMIMFAIQLTYADDLKLHFERSFPRDNTFCSHKGKRFELMLRGSSRHTEVRDRGYGEIVFMRELSQKKPRPLELNNSRTDTLRFFLGTSKICSKTHSYLIDKDTIAVLFLKENRPFVDKLVFQLLNASTFAPLSFIDSNYPTERVIERNGGFAFQTIPEKHVSAIGKISIEDEQFIYSEKGFPHWIQYSKTGFEIQKSLTFEKFPWRNFFKDEVDFTLSSGWDESKKAFTKLSVFYAVNHKLKRQCLLLLDQGQKPSDDATWKCQGL